MAEIAAAEHGYLSTACLHNLHNQCRKQCKFCEALCKCECHGVTDGEEVAAVIGLHN
jgi:hypothetical protein